MKARRTLRLGINHCYPETAKLIRKLFRGIVETGRLTRNNERRGKRQVQTAACYTDRTI